MVLNVGIGSTSYRTAINSRAKAGGSFATVVYKYCRHQGDAETSKYDDGYSLDIANIT